MERLVQHERIVALFLEATVWIHEHSPKDRELSAFCREAAAVLGITITPRSPLWARFLKPPRVNHPLTAKAPFPPRFPQKNYILLVRLGTTFTPLGTAGETDLVSHPNGTVTTPNVLLPWMLLGSPKECSVP